MNAARGDEWHLSRVTLRRDVSVQALAPLLLPDDENDRISASHRLIWSLFAGDANRQRDFLWHEEEKGRFLVFSPDKPDTNSALFEVESRIFTHWPRANDRLSFFLRANPTASQARPELKANGKRKGGRRLDLIMRALHSTPGRSQTGEALRKGQGRAFLREDLLGWLPTEHSVDARRPIHEWLAAQGVAAGFAVEQLQVNAYRRVQLPRPGKGPQDALVFGQADMEGELTVTDPAAFAARLKAGFGRTKAFGCGLMLLARKGEGI